MITNFKYIQLHDYVKMALIICIAPTCIADVGMGNYSIIEKIVIILLAIIGIV